MELTKAPVDHGDYRLRVEYKEALTVINAIESWVRRSQGQDVDKDVLYAMIQIANDLRNSTTAGLDFTGIDAEKLELLAEILKDYGLGSEFLAGLHADVDDARVPKHEPQSSVKYHQKLAIAALYMSDYLIGMRPLLDEPETEEIDGGFTK